MWKKSKKNIFFFLWIHVRWVNNPKITGITKTVVALVWEKKIRRVSAKNEAADKTGKSMPARKKNICFIGKGSLKL